MEGDDLLRVFINLLGYAKIGRTSRRVVGRMRLALMFRQCQQRSIPTVASQSRRIVDRQAKVVPDLRTRETLGSVDLVAAEDTRRTGWLLKRFGIRARMVSLHDANEAERTEELLQSLRSGRDVAVVSDAGMPGLSDPGFRLVRACVEAGRRRIPFRPCARVASRGQIP